MIPSYTLAGQLAYFVGKGECGLGLSYKEAVEEIPFELLLLMQKDKAHIVSEDTLVEVSEEYFIKQHGIKINKDGVII